jgi:ankyrin repeat protein
MLAGNTPLHLATWFGRIEAVKMLLEHGNNSDYICYNHTLCKEQGTPLFSRALSLLPPFLPTFLECFSSFRQQTTASDSASLVFSVLYYAIL